MWQEPVLKRISKKRAKNLVGGGGTFRDYLRDGDCRLFGLVDGFELWGTINEFYILKGDFYYTTWAIHNAMRLFKRVVKTGRIASVYSDEDIVQRTLNGLLRGGR